MLKFDSNKFLTIDRYENLIARVTGARQAVSSWLKQHAIR
jgi:hypothetical protein